MKKIYITLLAIAAIGASQVVLADDIVRPVTQTPPPPLCNKSQEYIEYSKCYNRNMDDKNARCIAILEAGNPCK
jgi:hypothetical protein